MPLEIPDSFCEFCIIFIPLPDRSVTNQIPHKTCPILTEHDDGRFRSIDGLNCCEQYELYFWDVLSSGLVLGPVFKDKIYSFFPKLFIALVRSRTHLELT